ncbi:MAG TPA: Uma2 family endonuclease [Solirubrobacteraceae bacterium]|jgi:Uma2 family endonuclease|nr:Uma2 family endonuclease [Solirubrobacteraceae bacterium]
MATQAVQVTSSDHTLPLYRMDVGTYERLVEVGALDGLDVELRDGLLVNRHPRREDAVHRIDVGTYERMVASGALEGRRVELLKGLLVAMSPQSPEHAAVVERLTRSLAGAAALRLRVQLPLEGEWDSVPEPDLALVERRNPPHRHPRTAMLVVEVAVTSHERDRGEKADMYAWAPIPVYWLVDVPGRAVEVRTDPGPAGYGRCEVYGVGATVPSPAEGVPDLDMAWLFEGLGD